MALSDEALAHSLQRGDRASLIALVERHYDALLGYLYRMVNGERALAEDLAQETFLRLLRGIGGYQYPRRFKPYLYAIATNLARSYYARAAERYDAGIAPDDSFTGDESPEGALLAADEARAVLDALNALPAPQREVIALFYDQQLSHAEIAEALNIPIGTVKSRLSIGISRLRERISLRDAQPESPPRHTRR